MKSDLDSLMADADLDALWVSGRGTHNPSLQYFTGTAQLTTADVIKKRGERPILFHSYMEQREAETTGLRAVMVSSEDRQRWTEAAEGDAALARALKIREHLMQAGVDGRVSVHGHVDAGDTLAVLRHLERLLPALTFVADAGHGGVLRLARLTKDPEEIERIRRLGQTTVEIVERVRATLSACQQQEGLIVDRGGKVITVGDIKRQIHLLLAERGAASPLGPFFALGREGAELHNSGREEAPLRPGVSIIFDLFPQENGGGYHFDITRTWCLGPAPDGLRDLHRDVRRVYEGVIPLFEAGASPRELQQEACRQFEALGHSTVRQEPAPHAGYLHSLGHGIGLDLHEPPSFRHYLSETSFPLAAGMVLAFEPGLYYPETGMAVRLEDLLLIQARGRAEVLAPYPHELELPIGDS